MTGRSLTELDVGELYAAHRLSLVRLAVLLVADRATAETEEFDRYRTYEWQITDSSATTLTSVDLGTLCIDDFVGTYGTCTS